MRKPLVLTAAASGTQVALSWPDVTETAWTGTPQVSYALYRDGAKVTGYDGNSRSYTDTGLAHGDSHRYRVTLLVGGAEAASSAASALLPARHDSDSDGLIEISNLAQLDAVRYDLNGDGVVDSSFDDESTADTDESEDEKAAYAAAFPVAEGKSVCLAEYPCTGYELTADLDFDTGTAGDRTDDDYYNGGAGWEPISRFTGVFDGGDHTIANLYINRPATSTSGLFARLGRGSEVRNLGLTGVDVNGSGFVGGLVGANYSRTISASYVTGTVTGRRFYFYSRFDPNSFYSGTGGLVGDNYGGTISNSYATATVTGEVSVGGLVGSNVAEGRGGIFASYATGTVTGDYHVGGLAGDNDFGPISASYATGTVIGGDRVGGLVGINQAKIIASYATGTVIGGGLRGRPGGS